MNKKPCHRFLAPFILTSILLATSSAAPGPEKGVIGDPPKLAANEDSGDERARYWEKGFNQVYAELLSNLKNPKPPFKTRYVQPGPAWPDQVFLWDTAFISMVWRLWDVRTAMEINLAVLDHAKDGMLIHSKSPYKQDKDTQPPVMAVAVLTNYMWSGDREQLAHAYPVLKDYNQWLYDNRRHPCGLFFWQHPFESGMDNSPRFTNRAVTASADMEQFVAVDLSSYVALQNRALEYMAGKLGREQDARKFGERVVELNGLINEKLWDEDDGIYYDRDMNEDELVKIKTIASLLPLFCAVPDPARAARLRDHVMDPAEFNTPMPLPSVARDEESFFLDMWRGPVWINTSYMVVEGLEYYGFHEEAAEIAFRTVDAVYSVHDKTGEFYEFFDPERDDIKKLHRKTTFMKVITGNDKPKPHFIGWTGLVNNLLVEHLIGLRKRDDGWAVCPRFPDDAAGMALKLTLPYPAIKLSVEVISRHEVRYEIEGDGIETQRFAVGLGRCKDIKVE